MNKPRFRLHRAKSALADIVLADGQLAVAELPVDSIGLVYGAPGSGKTTAVQARLHSLVGSGISPDQIMIFSATRESASSLRDLLALDLQTATAGPLAKTINSFAFSLISHRAFGSGLPAPELISGAEQDQILADIMASHDPEGLWPDHISKTTFELAGFRAELRDLLAVAIEHQLQPEQLKELAAKHSKPEWVGAAQILDDYLKMLASQEFSGRLDASSLLIRATELVAESPAVASIKAIIVDDAHELTPAASRFLLELCRVSKAGLVLFGDPDSVTLSFRAADPTGMRELAESVAKLHTVSIAEVNLLAAHAVREPQIGAVLAKISGQISVARAGRQRKGVNPTIAAITESDQTAVEGKIFSQAQDEISWLARRLRELHLIDGYEYKDLAVVVRSRHALEQWSSDLAHHGVPVATAANLTAPKDEFASRSLLELAQFVSLKSKNPDFETTLPMALELLSSPFCGLDAISLRRLRRALRREEMSGDGVRNSDQLIVALFASLGSVATIKGPEGRLVANFLKSIDQAIELLKQRDAVQNSIEDLLWLLWNNSGLASRWAELARGTSDVSLQANRNLDAVVALFAAANRFAERYPHGDSSIFIEQQLGLSVAEDTLATRSNLIDAVAVLTPAGLIGRRFKAVALPGLIEGAWPNLRARSSLLGAKPLDDLQSGRIQELQTISRSELPDELRMLHKAVGSASQKLLVSAAAQEDQQVSQFVMLMLGSIPDVSREAQSRFNLRAITAEQRKRLASAVKVANAAEAEQAAINLVRLSIAGSPGANPESWYGLAELSTHAPLVDLNSDDLVSISPSRLENFNKCPLHWFLDAHGANDGSFSANLGTIVHQTVEKLASDSAFDEASLWKSVESQWHTLAFEADWLERAAQRKAKLMIANIVEYLNQAKAQNTRLLGSEMEFNFVEGRANIRGKIDRIEMLEGGQVLVIDLKTGQRQPTANEAVHHSQLGLYQLAFEAGALDQSLEAALAGLTTDNSDAVAEVAQRGVEALTLGGAKLVLVGKDKLVQREQPPIGPSGLREEFLQQIQSATAGMADRVFVAQVDSHCTSENEYGSCKLHLIKAVSYVG